jgi:Cys-rich protein (TIGR01571 family)
MPKDAAPYGPEQTPQQAYASPQGYSGYPPPPLGSYGYDQQVQAAPQGSYGQQQQQQPQPSAPYAYPPPYQQRDSAGAPAPAYNTEPTAAVVGVPVPVYMNQQQWERGPWSTGLCDCLTHSSSCIETCFCMCFQFGYQWPKAQPPGSPALGTKFDALVCFGPLCLDMLCTFGCATAVTTMVLRNKTKMRYNIIEDPTAVGIIGLCCCPCSVCQTHREMTVRGEFPGGLCVSSRNQFRGGRAPRRLGE